MKSVQPIRRWKLSPAGFKTLLVIHIIAGVGLLGDSAGYLAIAIRTANLTDPLQAKTSCEILRMLAFIFGIPLSILSLLTGLMLGLSTKWGIWRYPWVIAKLLLTVSVMLVGALALKQGMDKMTSLQGNGELQLIAGSAYDVLALTLSTFLAVFKPGKDRQMHR